MMEEIEKIESLDEEEHAKTARMLFDMRQSEFPNNRSSFYEPASDTWILLAVLAGCLDEDKVNTRIINELGLRLDEAQLHQIIQRMLNNSDKEQRTKLAKICCLMHKLVCGRCACP
jgi:hypothetical protein